MFRRSDIETRHEDRTTDGGDERVRYERIASRRSRRMRGTVSIHRLARIVDEAGGGGLERLPHTVKILLENLLGAPGRAT